MQNAIAQRKDKLKGLSVTGKRFELEANGTVLFDHGHDLLHYGFVSWARKDSLFQGFVFNSVVYFVFEPQNKVVFHCFSPSG